MPKPSLNLSKILNKGELRDNLILDHQFLFFDLSVSSNGNGNGQPKDLSVTGSDADEWVLPGVGDDVIAMGGGDDLVEASAGADLVDGGNNGALGDTISYANWDSSVIVDLNGLPFGQFTDAQGDVIAGFENVIGSTFDDNIFGNFGDNKLFAGAGNDVVRGEHIIEKNSMTFPPTIFSSGNDLIYGEAGNDMIYGDDDAGRLVDALTGSSTTTFFGGDDTLHGGDNADTLVGDGDAWAKFTDRTATVNGGDDTLHGDAGDDTLIGDGFARQFVQGGSATINGGDDHLTGGTGNDTLWGDGLAFRLVTLPGFDLLTINGGADTFAFAEGDGMDRIMDFRQEDGDRIDLTAFDGLSFAGVAIAESASNPNDTVVTFISGDQITLVGFVDETLLGADDFIFAA